MKDYKEAIEKEAEKYAVKDFADKSSFEFHTQYTSFISGVNSKIAERIKIEFALGILNELEESDDVFAISDNLCKKISELKRQIK